MDKRDTRHLWVRFGLLPFCGKRGCGLLKTPANEKTACQGEESSGIRLLRGESRHEPEAPRGEKP